MKKLSIAVALLALPLAGYAQYAFDVLKYSQTQLRGTSRFVSMAGAFGALGGDMSVLGQNPAGIGVYRSSDVNVTGALDFNSAEATGEKQTATKFMFSNVGYVGSFKLNSNVMPTFNFGFSYNRINSFHRHYSGSMMGIPTSVTNFFAEKAMETGMTVSDLGYRKSFNPYFDGNALWDQIAAYQTNLINPTNSEGTKFSGLGYDGVLGYSEFEVDEWGHTDDYNVSFGGNVYDKFYWGLSVGFTELEYESYKYYGEALENTVIYDQDDLDKAKLVDGNVALGIVNESRTTGTGVNAKIGVIFKPVNEFRLGFAVHTPTYMNMRDEFEGNISAEYYGDKVKKYVKDEDYPTDNIVHYNILTPIKIIGSAAAVVGGKGILSADYEYAGNQYMRIKDNRGVEYVDATAEIKSYMQASHTLRVGAEYRVTPNFSLRAGYSYQTTPTQDVVKADKIVVETAGTDPSYSYDTSNQHITAGFGYHKGSFYFDMAYVNQCRKSNYHAFSGIADLPTVSTEVKDNNSRVTATLGFRF